MKYIYGPVNSRRLGLSLGVSLTPHKVCSFNCVYCQLGKTKEPTRQRQEYVKIEEMLNELRLWLKDHRASAEKLNYISLSGSGEPTLNIKLGEAIREIKKMNAVPVAVITNASLLSDFSLRQELLSADLIVPSLDTVSAEMFEKTNRPAKDIKIEEIIDGLVNLRKEFKGKIWLEVMLVKGINDDLRQIKKLKEVIDKINPHQIHLNSPVRTTTEPEIFPVEKSKLEKIRDILGDWCQII